MTALRQELVGEYGSWKAKRKIHTEERDLLQSEVNRLKAFLDRRNALRQEKARLQQGLGLLANQIQAVAMAHAKARQRRDVENSVLQMDLDHLKRQVEANRTFYAMRRAEQEHAAEALRNESSGLEEGVRNLELEHQSLLNLIASSKQNATSKQVSLAKAAQALQIELKSLQAEAKSQAAMRTRLDDEYRRLAKQGNQVMAERQQLSRDWKKCEEDLKSLDAKIGAAKQSFSKSKAELLACKELQGETQKLQEQLNICRAGQRAGV